MFVVLCALALAQAAVDPAAISARLAAVQALRSQRLATQAPAIPASAWAKAATGAVATGVIDVPGKKVKVGWGAGVFDHPIDRIWAGLNDELYHKDLLGLGHVEITQGSACADRRHVMMMLPLPVVSNRWWVVENRYSPGLASASGGGMRELSWKGIADLSGERLSDAARAKVEGAVQVTDVRGAWLLISLDANHTLSEYHTYTDPGGELPAGAASAFAASTIADTFAKIGRYTTTTTPRCLGKL